MPEQCPLTKLDNILLTTDGSEFSEGAVREGIRLAKAYSSKLFALSVVEANEEFMALAPRMVEKAEKEAREQVEAVRARATEAGVECEAIVREDVEPWRSIVDEVKRRHADVIIMGRRGRTGIKKLMMGSVTARVIGHAPCKVIVVPRAASLAGKTVLIATDGSKFSDKAAVEAINMSKRFGGRLVAISVASSEREEQAARKNVDKVTALAKREGVESQGVTAVGRPCEAILEAAGQWQADLIVMGSHGRTGLERLLMGSVAERVIVSASSAIMVAK
jgi:nucleotide-binding universal stress UspA family protein